MFGCDDFDTMRQAAVEGLGIAFLPDWVAGDDINSGGLIQLFPECALLPHISTGIYALCALLHPPARFTVFLDALRELIGHPAKWSLLRCQPLA
ncbi:LysR substrate-binding domain-containing protein [Serratia sp. BFP-2025]|uniref:LysR substrate-binding domain-containing protein n=1 Tax=Serratia sp. BFP-2025 TaxID=3433707 RepID=UPI003D7ED488